MPYSYFATPTDKVYPPTGHVNGRNAMRLIDWHRKGRNLGADFAPNDQAPRWLGGKWNGPLSSGDIASITAAGYGARIVTVNDPADLPPGLP